MVSRRSRGTGQMMGPFCTHDPRIVAELARTFNCGIGMVLIVGADKEQTVIQSLKESGGAEVVSMGRVVARSECPDHEIVVEHTENW
jgi:hypothetical protein